MTIDDAARFIAEHSGLVVPVDVVPEVLDRAYRNAARRLHPDSGGDPAMFRRLTEARDLLRARP